MPKLLDQDDMQTHQTLHHFQFSAVDMKNLGASEYTVVTICQDTSTSVTDFKKEMENCLKLILDACKKSPRSENLLLRLVEFNNDVHELHGFRELRTIDAKEYDDILKPRGMTALREAILNCLEATEVYGKQLIDMEYNCNAVMFIITDGDDNMSRTVGPDDIKKAIARIRKSETLESITTVLVGVGTDSQIQIFLSDLKTQAGLDQFVEIGAATPQKLAKLAAFVSKSISSTSQALGTGAASQPLTF